MQQQKQGLENKVLIRVKLRLQYTDKVLIGQGNQASVSKAKKIIVIPNRHRPIKLVERKELEKLCITERCVQYELFLGDCCELIKEKKIHEWIEQFIIDVGNGLLQIHQDGYIHVDIKPANIVYNQDNNNYSFSICDFSSLLREEDTKNKKCVGSPSYMPQEMSDKIEVQESGYTNAVDVWAFGVTLFELITLKDLFEDSTMSEKRNQQFVDQQIQIVQDEFYKLFDQITSCRSTKREFLEFFNNQKIQLSPPNPQLPSLNQSLKFWRNFFNKMNLSYPYYSINQINKFVLLNSQLFFHL